MSVERYLAKKDPAAILDYTLSWSQWLGTDTISAVTWTIPAGISKVNETATTTAATVWLTGGTAGTTYSIVCAVTTAAGRLDHRTITIKCEER